MPVLADVISTIDDRTREQLYRLASVRGYRLMTDRATGYTQHFIAMIGRDGRREPPRRRSPNYRTKQDARRALLLLMLDETRRSAA